jgi:hypothetical protein
MPRHLTGDIGHIRRQAHSDDREGYGPIKLSLACASMRAMGNSGVRDAKARASGNRLDRPSADRFVKLVQRLVQLGERASKQGGVAESRWVAPPSADTT